MGECSSTTTTATNATKSTSIRRVLMFSRLAPELTVRTPKRTGSFDRKLKVSRSKDNGRRDATPKYKLYIFICVATEPGGVNR